MSDVYDPNADPQSTLINYNKSIIGIPDSWCQAGGEGVRVAVLDTGFSQHTDVDKDTIALTYNALTKQQTVDDNSTSGHGTFIAGLIAAGRTPSATGLVGVAPRSRLIIVKVTEEDDSVTAASVLDGLNWLTNTCPKEFFPHIINLSVQFTPDEAKIGETLQNMFNELARRAIVLAAAQNDVYLSDPQIFYPASEQGVQGIGALDISSLLLPNGNYRSLNKKVKYVLPNLSYKSISNSPFNPYLVNQGCSFATAMVTGVLSLAISFQLRVGVTGTAMELLEGTVPSLDPASFGDGLEIRRTNV